ncbi:hypothetical protein K449DRAFT_390167 [Hypoxylon sp. EC38]|nr:hypothetical protein K449DRAFT_390167 [Hypoxylon sp. EC38]
MVGNGAQIIGKVNPDLTIKVLNAMDLGPNVGVYPKLPSHHMYLPYPSSLHEPMKFDCGSRLSHSPSILCHISSAISETHLKQDGWMSNACPCRLSNMPERR